MKKGRSDENVSHRIFAGMIGNIVLAVVLVALWLHYRAAKPMSDMETKSSNSAAQNSMGNSMANLPHRQKRRWFQCRFLRNACRASV